MEVNTEKLAAIVLWAAPWVIIVVAVLGALYSQMAGCTWTKPNTAQFMFFDVKPGIKVIG